jgi:hypothetical protein
LLDTSILQINVHDPEFMDNVLHPHVTQKKFLSKLRQIEEDPEGAGTAHLYSVTLKISGVANRAFEPLFERQVYTLTRL